MLLVVLIALFLKVEMVEMRVNVLPEVVAEEELVLSHFGGECFCVLELLTDKFKYFLTGSELIKQVLLVQFASLLRLRLKYLVDCFIELFLQSFDEGAPEILYRGQE